MDEPILYIFLKNVEDLMNAMGVSQTMLATKAGLSQGGVSDLLKNELFVPNPSFTTMDKIAKALGVPLVWLLTDHQKPTTEVGCFPDHEVVVAMLPKTQAVQVRMQDQRYQKDWERRLKQIHTDNDKVR